MRARAHARALTRRRAAGGRPQQRHTSATSHLDRCVLHWPPLRAPQQTANASKQRR
tara:strand:+ start:522 stop:689 length:168 start_codon:yes stop_codon:yes gene_type:complete